ncbi:MAG TPA: tetratricopeptide repeat protein [Solirubrobacteraceae bacterium]|nr:tetratricopeptide repeat protein [Solirubrobacteraceae bacterium]
MAGETERVVAETFVAPSRQVAQKHANELFRLGEIRARLGEHAEAERIFEQAATAFLTLGSPLNREWAAMARFRQSTVAADEGRFADALALIERLVKEFGGFPKFEQLPHPRYIGVDLWMLLLEQTEDYERLYVVAGTSLELLNPAGPADERIVIAKAVARRGRAARALGRNEEAAQLFEQAIALYKPEDPALVGKELINATATLTELRTEQGLVSGSVTESLTAFKQMVGTTATTVPKMAASRWFAARRKQQ